MNEFDVKAKEISEKKRKEAQFGYKLYGSANKTSFPRQRFRRAAERRNIDLPTKTAYSAASRSRYFFAPLVGVQNPP